VSFQEYCEQQTSLRSGGSALKLFMLLRKSPQQTKPRENDLKNKQKMMKVTKNEVVRN